MLDPVDPKAFLTLVELAIGNMYELEAIGELLEQKELMTKDEIITLAKDLKRKAAPTETTRRVNPRFATCGVRGLPPSGLFVLFCLTKKAVYPIRRDLFRPLSSVLDG